MNLNDNFLEDELGFIEDDDVFFNIGRGRRPNVLQRYAERFDPLELSGREFYTRFRFSKDSVENLLVPLLYPDGVRADDNRGLPFTLTQVLHLFKFSLGIYP